MVKDATAVSLVVAPFSLILGAIRPCLGAKAMTQAAKPLSLVNCAIFKCVLAIFDRVYIYMVGPHLLGLEPVRLILFLAVIVAVRVYKLRRLPQSTHKPHGVACSANELILVFPQLERAVLHLSVEIV